MNPTRILSDHSPVDHPVHRYLCCIMPVVTSHNTDGRNHSDPGFQRIITSLDTIKNKVKSPESDVNFLKALLESTELQSLVKVHQKVTTPPPHDKAAMTGNAVKIAEEAAGELDARYGSKTEAKELLMLLNKPHIKALFDAHDQVAAKDFLPQLPDIAHEVDEDEESVKVVRLVKGNKEPLGATIKLNEKTGIIHIARIMHGGAADRCGLIHVGDEVHEVNGIKTHGKSPQEVIDVISSTVGPILLKLVPGDCDYGFDRESMMRVRAHFTYEPTDDKMIPCREAGLNFEKGEILHIVNQDDENWWQARKEGDRNMRAGLIPSRKLQERRIKEMNSNNNTDESPKPSPKSSPLKSLKGSKSPKSPSKFSPKLLKKNKKTKKIIYHSQYNDDLDQDEVFTYEEVEKCYPKIGRYRPIILIGAPGVGRNELRKRLTSTNLNHFKSPVPCTSRVKKQAEVDGDEYAFMSKQDMENDIQNKRFVEYGEFKGNWYGTSMESVKSIINSGCTCVLCPHPQAIKVVRCAEFKPYIIFVKPPDLQKLKGTRTTCNAKSTFDEKNSRPFTNDEFEEIIQTSERIEKQYGQYFDQIIVNEDLQKAANELSLAAHNVETEPLWVPAHWVT